MSISHYVGYAHLEELAEIMVPEEPVFGLLSVETETDEHAHTAERHVGVVSQIDPRGHLHYCRILLAVTERVGDTSFNSDYEARQEAAQEGWSLITDWLSQKGFDVRCALVAVPRTHRLLSGRACFLLYDAEGKTWRLADADSGEETGMESQDPSPSNPSNGHKS